MSSRKLFRILIPAILVAAAVMVWLFWPREAQQTDLPVEPSVALIALALVSAAHSFFTDLLDLPIGVWIFILLIPVAAVVLFLWPALGMSAAVVLIGLAVLWFMFS
ncbi:MAG TPA: hypothetical protein VKA94_06225 [Hyphomicrobiales bacterium]|nr:hypothetical protein [Hyphomicrobiales bacterium]